MQNFNVKSKARFVKIMLCGPNALSVMKPFKGRFTLAFRTSKTQIASLEMPARQKVEIVTESSHIF